MELLGIRNAYEPRRSLESPLYRLVNDEIETWLSNMRAGMGEAVEPCSEDSLRSFLMCGIHRFGVVRPSEARATRRYRRRGWAFIQPMIADRGLDERRKEGQTLGDGLGCGGKAGQIFEV